MTSDERKPPEIIAIASGKGGTGKSLFAACLGYALGRAQHRVLLIDADPGTDGLSLFLLGPKGMNQATSFESQQTFRGVLNEFRTTGELRAKPRRINRSTKDDHGCDYTALISGNGLYGDFDPNVTPVPDLDNETFRKAICALFTHFRSSFDYDYIVVDTRGGFAFESTDVCAAADSFILVTDADYTSFYQDRNLVSRISAAAKSMQTKTLLRAILVNRAVEGEENSFRLQLEKEFPIRYIDTFAIPLDLEALKAYRVQQMPYVKAPASGFSHATLSAFSDILQIVTAQWPRERVDGWNGLVNEVSNAIERRNAELQLEEERQRAREIETDRARNDLGSARVLYRALLAVALIACLAMFAIWIFAPREKIVYLASADAGAPLLVTVDTPDGDVLVIPPDVPSAPVDAPPVAPDPPVTLDAGGALDPIPAPTTLRTSKPPDPILRLTSADLALRVIPRVTSTPITGEKAANGKQVFRYVTWLSMDPELEQRVTSVRYTYNHSSFDGLSQTLENPPSFRTTHEAWGCINSISVTLMFSTGPSKSFDFDECAVLKNPRSSAKAN
jgi:MinD-like ATPase involved in chromosome partitioning or flagellar assembly